MSINERDFGAIEERGSINEFAVIGEFGFQRVPGPFEIEKSGTIWNIVVPTNAHPTVSTLSDQEGEAVALVADAEIVGGGVLTDVVEKPDSEELDLLVDQYAMSGGN